MKQQFGKTINRGIKIELETSYLFIKEAYLGCIRIQKFPEISSHVSCVNSYYKW